MELKYLDYKSHYSGFGGQIAYVVADDQVIFSGLTTGFRSTCTIDAAEYIVMAICEAEGLEWRSITFFDIKTHMGYNYKPRGSYEVNKLHLVPIINASFPFRIQWETLNHDDFPLEVWELFGPFIG